MEREAASDTPKRASDNDRTKRWPRCTEFKSVFADFHIDVSFTVYLHPHIKYPASTVQPPISFRSPIVTEPAHSLLLSDFLDLILG